MRVSSFLPGGGNRENVLRSNDIDGGSRDNDLSGLSPLARTLELARSSAHRTPPSTASPAKTWRHDPAASGAETTEVAVMTTVAGPSAISPLASIGRAAAERYGGAAGRIHSAAQASPAEATPTADDAAVAAETAASDAAYESPNGQPTSLSPLQAVMAPPFPPDK